MAVVPWEAVEWARTKPLCVAHVRTLPYKEVIPTANDVLVLHVRRVR